MHGPVNWFRGKQVATNQKTRNQVRSAKNSRVNTAPFFAMQPLSFFIATIGLSTSVFALPTGEQVVSGNVHFAQPNSATLVIDQQTNQAIVNWQSFSIQQNELVQINQPNSNAVMLNRVVGNDPSNIYGQLKANGHVFLVNPNGILFAQNARVDVGSLVASTLAISDQNFLDRNYVFMSSATTADANASVVNGGKITTVAGGYVALISGKVNNSGEITAQEGSIGMAAGSKVVLDFDKDGLINFKVDPRYRCRNQPFRHSDRRRRPCCHECSGKRCVNEYGDQ